MSYHVKRSDGDLQSAVRRIAVDQIDSALEEIASDALPFDKKVHQARKRCKKLRGLVRLVRPVFKSYSKENKAFRDTARQISDIRDAGSLIETYDSLTSHFDEEIDRRAFAPIRRRLTMDAKRISGDPEAAARMEAVKTALGDARGRAAEWHLKDKSFDALDGGVSKTYTRARKSMEAAWRKPEDEQMHQWRKRAKYHWYHVRLLRGVQPSMMDPREAAADELSDLLGNHHDMAVMEGRLRDAPSDFGPTTDVEAFCALLQKRKQALETRAFDIGRLLLAERRKALVNRWNGYLANWQEAKPRRRNLLVKA